MSTNPTNLAIAPMPHCPVCQKLGEVCAPDARTVIEAERRIVERLRDRARHLDPINRAYATVLYEQADAIERGEL